MRSARHPGREAARQALADDERRTRRRSAGRDLVQRDFTASRPNGSGSPTSPTCAAGRASSYLAFVIDAYSRRVVGWQFASHMRTDLVLDALRMALGLRAPGADVELVHHSDGGSQYTVDRLHPGARRSPRPRLGRFGRRRLRQRARRVVRRQLQDRADLRPRLATRVQLELAIVEYIGWFNNARLHEALGDIPPAEFEERWDSLPGEAITFIDRKTETN